MVESIVNKMAQVAMAKRLHDDHDACQKMSAAVNPMPAPPSTVNMRALSVRLGSVHPNVAARPPAMTSPRE